MAVANSFVRHHSHHSPGVTPGRKAITDETGTSTRTVVCDYWVALSEHAGVLWIYQTRLAEDDTCWFLHGSRRRIWIDAQTRKWHSFEELNAWLGERCRSLWEEIRHPEYKHFSVLEMLEQERSEMMPMPTPFDGYVERSAKVSSTCLVEVARTGTQFPRQQKSGAVE